MTPEAFADLVGATREEVDEYRSHGLLDPEGDGLLDDVDILRMHVIDHQFQRGGHDLESIAVAIREGRVGSMFGKQLFEHSKPLALDDAAARVGLDPEQLSQLLAALGFPSASLREFDLEILDVIRTARDAGLPWDAILGMTRVLGDSLRRIADTEIRIVHTYIHERLIAEGVPEDEVEQQIFGIEENLAPLMEPMIHRLHREYLVEASIEDAFLHVTAPGRRGEELGSIETTIAFVDIASFTALAETSGDDTAVRVLDLIDAVVRRKLVEHDGKLVKHVGDGFMLAFRDPADAVRFALATQAELARDPDLPAIRVGINTGPALYRTGDYLGGAVNVAARVVASAMAGQIVLTEPVAKAASNEGIPVEELGVRMMRGVDDPLALYRVRPG
jgi:class 3 adenylate cyclase